MTNENYCQQCGTTFHGRPDKRFCNDRCRSRYNNKLNRDATNEVKNTNNLLRKNRRILEAFAGQKVEREKLSRAGFDFEHYTRTFSTEKGATYRLCYDMAYLQLEGGFRIVK